MSDAFRNWRAADDGTRAVYESDKYPAESWEVRIEQNSAATWDVTLYHDGETHENIAMDIASKEDAKQEMVLWVEANQVILG